MNFGSILTPFGSSKEERGIYVGPSKRDEGDVPFWNLESSLEIDHFLLSPPKF